METKELNNNSERSSDGRLPSLDGWRALSILLVLIQHSASMQGWPASLQNSFISAIGGVGVRFFFVISGFLITWLLIKEHIKFGSISIKSFYIRRFLRILPVFCLFLFSVYLLQCFHYIHLSSEDYLIAGTFMGDLWKTPHPLSHLWSLAVEEKFYVFWPMLFILFFKIEMKVLAKILIVFIVISPILRGLVDVFQLGDQSTFFNNHSFFIISDGLALGCLGAIFWSKYQEMLRYIFAKYSYAIFFAAGFLIALPAIFWLIPSLKILQPLQDTLQCSGFLVLMLQSIALPRFFVYNILNIGVIAHIGVISYSIYVWMGIAELPIQYAGIPVSFTNGFPGWIIVVVILAELSYNLVEAPLMQKKKAILTWFGLNR